MATRKKREKNPPSPLLELSEDEVEILEIPPKRRPRKKTKVEKKPIVEQQPEEDVLVGLDLEGVPEEEREQIKQALIASRNDVTGCDAATSVRSDRLVQGPFEMKVTEGGDSEREESDEDCLVETKKCRVTLDASSDGRKVNGATPMVKRQVEVTEDDETQPPEDEEDLELCAVFDASKSTLMENEELYDCSTQEDEPSDSFTQQEAVATLETQDYALESPTTEEVQMKESQTLSNTSAESSQGFEPAVNVKDIKCKATDSEVSTGHASSPARSPAGTDGRHRQVASAEAAVEQEGLHDNRSVPGSQGTSKEQAKRSDSLQDCSLVRHFRKVKRKPTLKDCYFATEDMDKERCATVILQLFETYCRKLRRAQSRCKNLAEWGEPVKSGNHLSKTIDAKKRGQDSMYVFLSDEEDDDFEEKMVTAKKQKVQYDDEELPDIDQENKRVDTREARSRKGLARTVSGVKCDNKNLASANSVKQSKSVEGDSYTVRQSRLKRKTKQQILVEDTQIDEEWKERAGLSRGDYIVEETQQSDDDEDWLSVKSRSGKGEFENQMQKAKMQGYTIPKRKATNADKERLQECEEERKVHETISLNETTDNSKVKRQTKGQKRKADHVKSGTLVEDTQDVTDYATKSGKHRNKTKRSCFKIESDSESESEIIPESQEIMEESCNVSVIEKQPSPNSKPEEPPSSFLTKVVNKVKSILTPRKEENVQANEEEGSQSPVIKQRKLYKASQTKFGLELNELNDEDDEAYNAFKKKSNQKSNAAHVVDGTKQKRDKIRSENKDKNSKDGVRKLIGRAPSGESNVSDDISVTSSQISNTMLDDNGDLFSTQFMSTKNREHGGINRGQPVREIGKKYNKALNSDEKIEDVLTVDSSDDDVLVVKEVKNTYAKGKPEGKRQQVNCDISQYFDKKASSKSVPQDEYKGNKAKTNPAVISNINNVINDTTDDTNTLPTDRASVTMEEDPYVSHGHSDAENMPQTNNGSEEYKSNKDAACSAFKKKVPIVSIPEIHTELDVAMVKDDINGVGYIDPGVIPAANSRRTNTRRAAQQKMTGIGGEPYGLLGGDSNAPVILKGSDRFELGDADVLRRTRRARRRKVSETISSAEFEAGASRSTVTMRDIEEDGSMEIGGARKKTRRLMQKPFVEVASPVKKKEEMITCPLCDDDYPQSVIEKHAGNCVGPEPPEELLAQQLGHTVDSEEEAELELLMHHSQHHNSHVHHPNENVREVVKHMTSSSPAEAGEMVLCYICDVNIPKGILFDQHLSHCIEEAKQQQMEVDKHGFARAYQQPTDGEEIPARTTRAAVRTKKEDGAVGGRPEVEEVSSSKTMDMEDRYSSADVSSSGQTSGDSEYSNSNDSDSSSSDNVTLATVARSRSSALITGPWNKDHASQSAVRQQSCDQSELPDWMKYTSTSPIKSFVPISQQDDQNYFQKQFSYKKDTVEKRMRKRKTQKQGGKKKRRKKRKQNGKKSKKSV